MRIAVVIPAFNVGSFLLTTLRSVFNQISADWSLIVVDDGSTDETAAVAAGFSDPRIRLIRQENSGVSAARNRGIAAFLDNLSSFSSTAPDAFLFLDGDDWLAPDALSNLEAALEMAPWAAAACGFYARVDASGCSPPRLAPSPPAGCLLERLLTGNLFANGGHLLIRREAIEAAGRFRADLSFGEDWEYWTRVALLGEFVSVQSRKPVLFVRERPAGTYCSNATNPAAYRPAMDAIFSNPAMTDRLGANRMACLRQAAEAEMAWSVGRELIRGGQRQRGQHWLGQSIWMAPRPKRLALIGLSWLRSGPFRPYGATG
jgi:glycosyltransferase involved in cell wall biosynthesis